MAGHVSRSKLVFIEHHVTYIFVSLPHIEWPLINVCVIIYFSLSLV